MTNIRLAISPCPNDTFIFDPMVNNRVDMEGIQVSCSFHDVETLNRMAMAGEADMIKVSFYTWLMLRKEYTLLESGSALGHGNGPLLISKENYHPDDIPNLSVAIPGEHTTAHLLFSIAAPPPARKIFMTFSDIEQAILTNRVDAGVIIHENRFTYAQKGLRKMIDLGQFWEELTQAPIPLGGIVVRKDLPEEIAEKLGRIMHRSVAYAFEHPEIPMPFVRQHASEMDPAVMKKHIELYVTANTLSLGDDGHRAISTLTLKALEKGLIRE